MRFNSDPQVENKLNRVITSCNLNEDNPIISVIRIGWPFQRVKGNYLSKCED